MTAPLEGKMDSNHYTKEAAFVDFKLELVLIPVSDVDRAKAFYTEKTGFTWRSIPSWARRCASYS